VDIEVTVAAVDGRKVTLDARVSDEAEIVGTGVHVRFVVDVPRQIRRVEAKRKLIESRA
jgi:predicted thioesterase